MSRNTRNLVRAALPLILALGLASLMIRPMAAEPVGTAGEATADSQLPSTDWDHAKCRGTGKDRVANGRDGLSGGSAARVPPVPSGNVQASISAVAFSELVQVVNGRVHTPILVNAAEPCGVATVVGAPENCSVVARPGVVAWLDCALPRKRAALTIEVRLADGARFSHTTAAVA